MLNAIISYFTGNYQYKDNAEPWKELCAGVINLKDRKILSDNLTITFSNKLYHVSEAGDGPYILKDSQCRDLKYLCFSENGEKSNLGELSDRALAALYDLLEILIRKDVDPDKTESMRELQKDLGWQLPSVFIVRDAFSKHRDRPRVYFDASYITDPLASIKRPCFPRKPYLYKVTGLCAFMMADYMDGADGFNWYHADKFRVTRRNIAVTSGFNNCSLKLDGIGNPHGPVLVVDNMLYLPRKLTWLENLLSAKPGTVYVEYMRGDGDLNDRYLDYPQGEIVYMSSKQFLRLLEKHQAKLKEQYAFCIENLNPDENEIIVQLDGELYILSDTVEDKYTLFKPQNEDDSKSNQCHVDIRMDDIRIDRIYLGKI
ncbi:hypothetical protein [Vibrio phage BONAISHI]|nr:hypothetical protein [Vibrio phage BONAISHI]